MRLSLDTTKGRWNLYFYFFIFFTLYFHSFLFPGSNVAFDRVLHDQGYANSQVSSILQCPKGFIWFGTSEGLCRYDGYRCKVYRHDPEVPGSISNSDIECLYLDRQKNLWIGTENGLNMLDMKTETFTTYKNNPDDPESLSCNKIVVINEDSNSSLWIGTFEGGLNLFNRKTGKFIRFQHNDENSGSLSHDRVTAICEDATHELWIGTKYGLNRFMREKGTFIHYKNEPGKNRTLSHDFIWTLYNDSSGTLWIGTLGGGSTNISVKR